MTVASDSIKKRARKKEERVFFFFFNQGMFASFSKLENVFQNTKVRKKNRGEETSLCMSVYHNQLEDFAEQEGELK